MVCKINREHEFDQIIKEQIDYEKETFLRTENLDMKIVREKEQYKMIQKEIRKREYKNNKIACKNIRSRH